MSDYRGLFVISVLVLGFVGWVLFGSDDEQPKQAIARAPKPVVEAAKPAEPVHGHEEPAPPRNPTAKPTSSDPVVSADPDDPHHHMAHPHPITEQHKLLAHERAVIQALNDAMDRGDGQAMRPFITEYKNNHHEDPHALQAGYEVIADCLEHPGEESRDAAERYYEEERASTLRRFVRRHCFDDQFPD